MKNGIMAKVFVVRPYGELYRNVVAEESVVSDIDVPSFLDGHPPLGAPEHHGELGWIDGPASGYSKEKSLQAVAKRYDTVPAKIPVTLARPGQDRDFGDLVSVLRVDGWRDWHILLAVSNVALNTRVRLRYGPGGRPDGDLDEMRKGIFEVWYDLEAEGHSIIDLGEFHLETLRQALELSMASTSKGLGLECHQDTPDVPAIREFLSRRYNYWTDDIEHDDPFKVVRKGLIVVSPRH